MQDAQKVPPSKVAASEEARRTLRYVEPLSAARTPLGDFFSILLVTPRGFRGRKAACYSSDDDGISRCFSQRAAAVQVLVASHRRAADDRGLFWAVLAQGHAVVCALPHSGSGIGCMAVGIGIQSGSDRVARASAQSDSQSDQGCAGRTQSCTPVGTAALCLDLWRQRD